MAKQRYYRGDTFAKILYFKNESGVLVDPVTVSIPFVDPDGTTKSTKTLADLTKTATGTYKVYYGVPSDGVFGTWTMQVMGTLAGGIQNREDFTFIVEEK